jgi:hypothetical protein
MRGNQLPAIIHTKPAVSGRLHSVRNGRCCRRRGGPIRKSHPEGDIDPKGPQGRLHRDHGRAGAATDHLLRLLPFGAVQPTGPGQGQPVDCGAAEGRGSGSATEYRTSQADDKPCRFLAVEPCVGFGQTIYHAFDLTHGIKAVLNAVPVRSEVFTPVEERRCWSVKAESRSYQA